MDPSHLVFSRVSVAGTSPVEFCLDPDDNDPVAPWLMDHDWIDEPVMRAFLGLVTPGVRVIDLGSHLGTFALPAARLGAEVIAVDANEHHLDLLSAAGRRNSFDALHVVHGMITDSAEPVPFIERTIHGAAWTPQDGKVATTLPPNLTVDGLLERFGWDDVDVIKMDVEGSEAAAVRGMRGLHARGMRPSLVLECNGAMLPRLGSSIAELLETLTLLGYELLMIDHLRPGTLVEALADGIQTECVCDYLALASRPDNLASAWRIEPPFTRQQTLSRLLEGAAHVDGGYRRYAIEVLTNGPAWLREAATTSLGGSGGPEVGEASNVAPNRADDPVHGPRSARAPEDTFVRAAGVCLALRRPEPDRPSGYPTRPGQLIVNDVSFELRPGQALAVLVDDAAAGVALLDALAGRAPLAAGQLEVRARCTLVSGIESVLEPELTVAENTFVYAAFLGVDVRANRGLLTELPRLAGLHDLADTRLRQLPAAAATRIALSVVLSCVEPELLLLGPFPTMNAMTRGALADRIAPFRERGMAIVEVVNAPDRLISQADRILWIEHGTVRACAEPNTVAAVWQEALSVSSAPVGRSA